MDFSKILITIFGSIFFYLIFLFLGFRLRDKNIKAQNLYKNKK